jgi:hypothetical protein
MTPMSTPTPTSTTSAPALLTTPRDFSNAQALQGGQSYSVEYDALVIAVGCYSASFGIPGVSSQTGLGVGWPTGGRRCDDMRDGGGE